MLREMLNERLKLTGGEVRGDAFNLREFRESLRSQLAANPSALRQNPSTYPRQNLQGPREGMVHPCSATNLEPRSMPYRPPSRRVSFLQSPDDDQNTSKNDSFVRNGSISIPNFVTGGVRGRSLNSSMLPHPSSEPKGLLPTLPTSHTELIKTSLSSGRQVLRSGLGQLPADCSQTRKWQAHLTGERTEVDQGLASANQSKITSAALKQTEPGRRSFSAADNLSLRGSTLPFTTNPIQIRARPPSRDHSTLTTTTATDAQFQDKVEQSLDRLFKDSKSTPTHPPDSALQRFLAGRPDSAFAIRKGLPSEYPADTIRQMTRRFEAETPEDFGRLDDA